MNTITVQKIKYEALEKKANLYDRFFKRIANTFFETESYSKERIKEFSGQDKLSKENRTKILKLLK